MSRDRLITPSLRAELLANGARSAAGHDTDPAPVVERRAVHPGRGRDRTSRRTPINQRFKTAFISAPHRGFIYILEREGARKDGRSLIASRMPERGRERRRAGAARHRPPHHPPHRPDSSGVARHPTRAKGRPPRVMP